MVCQLYVWFKNLKAIRLGLIHNPLHTKLPPFMLTKIAEVTASHVKPLFCSPAFLIFSLTRVFCMPLKKIVPVTSESFQCFYRNLR